ncbi:hypothetical protein ZIOFF_074492 (mitochondrion) [Zingiber officinale]|uniref:Uncharacterized protein n=1 Tax=Zingiber officinale TaxID=94328 RepID=A0A8J5BYE8_ZINOF|nr:hypothetical protein ZIOFF_074492 [Zingiber officinale]
MRTSSSHYLKFVSLGHKKRPYLGNSLSQAMERLGQKDFTLGWELPSRSQLYMARLTDHRRISYSIDLGVLAMSKGQSQYTEMSSALLVYFGPKGLRTNWESFVIATKLLDRLVGKKDIYCFDLKAATDRWPVGYHSSWLSNLSLTHHILVWWAAEQVYPGRKFLDYALLGDDIAIADRLVALYFGLATPRRYHLRTEVSDLGVSYKDQVLGKETSYCERDELCSEREGPDSGEEAKERLGKHFCSTEVRSLVGSNRTHFTLVGSFHYVVRIALLKVRIAEIAHVGIMFSSEIRVRNIPWKPTELGISLRSTVADGKDLLACARFGNGLQRSRSELQRSRAGKLGQKEEEEERPALIDGRAEKVLLLRGRAVICVAKIKSKQSVKTGEAQSLQSEENLDLCNSFSFFANRGKLFFPMLGRSVMPSFLRF